MSNNAYLIYIPDEKDKTKIEMRSEGYLGGYEPPEYTAAIDVVIAESPGKAKSKFLKDYYWRKFIYSDEWNRLRVRLLSKEVSIDEKNYDEYWNRAHEILDHNNKPCDCPEEIIYDFGEVDIKMEELEWNVTA